jgi:hypothetical protein
MGYKLQKILLSDCTVYNIVFEDRVLGHLILTEHNTLLVQNEDLNIVPLAESFGFSGKAYIANENGYEEVMLNGNTDLAPLYEYKVINLDNQSLISEEI